MSRAICPRCGARDVHRSDAGPLQAGGSFVGVTHAGANDLALEATLCARCGHVELGVAPRHLPHVAKLLASGSWTRVTEDEAG